MYLDFQNQYWPKDQENVSQYPYYIAQHKHTHIHARRHTVYIRRRVVDTSLSCYFCLGPLNHLIRDSWHCCCHRAPLFIVGHSRNLHQQPAASISSGHASLGWQWSPTRSKLMTSPPAQYIDTEMLQILKMRLAQSASQLASPYQWQGSEVHQFSLTFCAQINSWLTLPTPHLTFTLWGEQSNNIRAEDEMQRDEPTYSASSVLCWC